MFVNVKILIDETNPGYISGTLNNFEYSCHIRETNGVKKYILDIKNKSSNECSMNKETIKQLIEKYQKYLEAYETIEKMLANADK